MNHKGYFDGSSKGNPGPAQCGWVILDESNTIIAHGSKKANEDRTNNVAEYMGLIELLKYLTNNNDIKNIEVFGDSKLVINQIFSGWKCKSPNIKPYFNQAMRLFEYLTTIKQIKLTWIPREENTIADSLAQKGRL